MQKVSQYEATLLFRFYNEFFHPEKTAENIITQFYYNLELTVSFI